MADAADYISGLTKEGADLAKWRVAIEALIRVSRSGPTKLAQIAVINALRSNVVQLFDPDRKGS